MKLNDFSVAMAVSIAMAASGATYRISAPIKAHRLKLAREIERLSGGG